MLMGGLLSLLILFTALGGVLMTKQKDQRKRDRQRRTYALHFPSDLSADAVTNWVRSISGTLRGGAGWFDGVPTIVFEVWSTGRGIEHYLKVPWQHSDYVISQLLAHVPGLSYTPVTDEIPRRLWVSAQELAMSNKSRPLRIFSASMVSSSLLASMQSIESGEAVMAQMVITPAIPSKLPLDGEMSDTNVLFGNKADKDEITERRAKLSEPNVLATLRIASVAETKPRAEHLITRVRSALQATRSPSTHFKPRSGSLSKLQNRIDNGTTPLSFAIQLSAPELTALVAWPIGSPFITGLPPALARRLPAPSNVPSEGRIIGRSNMPGNERPVAIPYSDAVKHTWVAGSTGVGKTALLANMVKQDIEHGHGVVLIEAKGDLFRSVLDYVPWNRLDDVIVMDVNDRKHPVGFNILQQGSSDAIVDEIGALFSHMYGGDKGVFGREVLYHALQTLITDPRMTFVDIVPLLVPMTTEEIAWADDLKRSLKDRELKNFWQRFDNKGQRDLDRFSQPVLDRVWQLNARPEIKRIIGQSESSFQLSDVIRNNKILLINLSGLPRETASLVGTLIVNSLWHAVVANRPERPNFLYIDEFADFTNLPIDAEEFLAKSRSFGLGLVLAHQHLGQLPNDLKSAVLANARSKIVFQTSADDAGVMEREFGSSVTRDDFTHLGRYEAFARIATNDTVSAPVSITTNAPAPGHNYSRELLERSRKRYSRHVEDVDKAIAERRNQPKQHSGRKPRLGRE